MKAFKEHRLRLAFVLDGNALRDLLHVIDDVSRPVKYSVSLSDGSTLYPRTIDELDQLPNPEQRRIVKIIVESDWADRVRTTISFEDSCDYWSISYSLEGEEADVVFVDRQFHDWLATIKQWYSRFVFSTPTTWALWAVMWLLGIALVFIGPYAQRLLMSGGTSIEITTLVAGTVMLVLVCSKGWIRKRFFPRGMFAIGAGKQRSDAVKARRARFNVGALVVAVLIGLVTTVIMRILRL